jgi:glycosyltransferase involved in cell wall biosynthesis
MSSADDVTLSKRSFGTSARRLANDVPQTAAELIARLVSLLRHRNSRSLGGAVEELRELSARGDVRALDVLLKRLQVALGHRPISLGIYDHALHVVGGGQKYAATIAATLQERFDVTYLVNEDVDLRRVADWYGLDLSGCRTRVVALPFYGARQWIDSSVATAERENPFDPVAVASADYDLFVNANMLEKVRPLAPLSVFLCHFPDVPARRHFAAHEYTVLVANSRYTADWVHRKWGLDSSALIYPPVDAAGPQLPKDSIILSVARFEPGGSKKQLEMIQAFRALRSAAPERLAGWRLVLVGGSLRRNAYLERVRKLAGRDSSVEVRVDIPFDELKNWYARASIFWHACGLEEQEPHLIEHFGMTTAEAMQNGCAPIVIDGGGQREIVEHGVSGFRFSTLEELCAWTLRLIDDPRLRESIQYAARKRSGAFSRPAFEANVRRLFDVLEREYSTFAPADSPRTAERLDVDSPRDGS